MTTLPSTTTEFGGGGAPAEAAPRHDLLLLAACLLACALAGVFFWPTLQGWYWDYVKPDSYYAHGFLVPVLAAVMLWHLRERIRTTPKQPSLWGFALLLPMLGLQILAQKIYMPSMMSASLLLSVVGAVWLLGGGALVRTCAFPLGFLWFMAPLPGPLLNDGTLKMQMTSTSMAAHLLPLIGFSATRDGNLIQMENYLLNVDVPCSGFNLLLRLLTFSMAFAYLTDGSILRRAGLFVFSLPLSLAINAIRITSIGIVGECLGTRAALAFHDWGGILSLILCMALLFGFAKGMGCKTFAGQPIF